MRILVAEDDAAQLCVLEELLVTWGYDVLKARDGGEAWQVLTQEDAPTLAIVDWQMPDVYGTEICRRYREMFSSRPAYFILITGKGSQEDLIAGLDAGADDYVTKPFVLEDLRARVQVGVRTIELQERLAGYAKELEQEISERKRAEEAVRRAHDGLEMLVRERTAELTATNRQLQEEIAEREAAERALRESKARLYTMMQSATDAIISTDSKASIVSWNKGAKEMFGYEEEEALGKPVTMLMPEPRRDSYRDGMRRMRRSGQYGTIGKPLEMHGLKKDGSVFPVENTISEWKVGDARYFTSIIRDITERKQAEEELHQALDKAKQRSVETAALLDGARAILEQHDFERAARALFDACKDLIGATAGCVALLSADETVNEVLFLDSGGLPCSVDPGRPMPILGLRGEAFRDGKAVYHNDFYNSRHERLHATRDENRAAVLPPSVPPRRGPPHGGEAAGVHSPHAGAHNCGEPEGGESRYFQSSKRANLMPEGHPIPNNVLFAPLMIEGKVVGLIGLAEKQGGFTENDARMAAAFGQLAAIALANAQTREALETSDERLKSVVETATDAIVTIDSRGNITYWNRAAETIFGYSADEMIGKPLGRIVPERYREGHEQGVSRVTATGDSKLSGGTIEINGLRKNGSEFPLELSLATSTTSEGTFFTGIIRDTTVRKRREAQVEDALSYMETLQDNSPDSIIATDARGRITIFNPGAEELLGYRVEEIVGQPAERLYPSREDAKAIMHAMRTEPAGRVRNMETLLRHKHGRLIPVLISASILRGADGQEQGTVGYSKDLTARKKTELRVRKQQEFLQNVLESLSHPFYVVDVADYRVRMANAAARGGRELNGDLTCYAMTHGRDTPCSEVGDVCPVREIRKTGRPVTVRHVHVAEDGKPRYVAVHGHPLFDDEGKVAQIIEYCLDITEQTRSEEALRRLHGENKQLLQSISSILIGVDGGDRVTQWNAVAEHVFGIAAEDVVGCLFSECGIAWDLEKVQQGVTHCRLAHEPTRVDDISFSRLDGTEGFLGATITPITADGAGRSGFLFLGRDITERRVLEAQFAQAQKLEAIGQLAAGIAHEINTPMQYVGDNTLFVEETFADLSRALEVYDHLFSAAKEGSISPDVVAHVEEVIEDADIEYLLEEIPQAISQSQEGINRVKEIVGAMKEFSHPGVEEKAAVDINKTIESTITVARNEWKYVAEMQTDFDPGLPLVSCFPGEFNQAILNILVNAAHAIRDRISENGSVERGTIAVSTHSGEDWVEIRIRDTGTGIPEDVRPRIFDPFFTTKEVGRGTGQGLSVVHSVIVEKHKGTITFDTKMGEGTTFVIRLPAGDR